MRRFLFVLVTVISVWSIHSQNKNQLNILDKFIIAHNDGSDKAIMQFMKDTYLPEIYANINVNDHLSYYKQIINDYGTLSNQIYYLVEESPLKLIVHLIKKEDNIRKLEISPNDILQVELNLSQKNPEYIERGLGLGPFIDER